MKDRNVEVSPLVRSFIDDIDSCLKHSVIITLVFYLLFLLILFGVTSIFYGQPFLELEFLGMPIHEAWAKANPELVFGLIFLSAVLAAVCSFLLSKRSINKLKRIILKDCDAYTYLTVMTYAMSLPTNRVTDFVYTLSYVEALCLNGKFEEALKFTEPFENDKRKRIAWLYVKLNTVQTIEEFEKFSSEYKRKSVLFDVLKLSLNQDYQGVIDFVTKNIKPDVDYYWVYSNYHLAKAYYALGDVDKAFYAITICFYGSLYLPYLHSKAFELYKVLSKEVLDVDILSDLDEFDESVMQLEAPDMKCLSELDNTPEQ